MALEKNDYTVSMVVAYDLQGTYNKIRTTARPTAEMETSVPMQYLITSYFAASSPALSA